MAYLYEVLIDYGSFLGIEGVPGMALPDLDLVFLAAGYGLPGHRVTNQNDFGDSLRATISSGTPSLLDVEVEPGNSGMFEK